MSNFEKTKDSKIPGTDVVRERLSAEPVDPIDVYAGLHLRPEMLKTYVDDVRELDPVYKAEIERHLLKVCNKSGHCQAVIDNIVRQNENDDPKIQQLPKGDR